ncbi:molybdenum cofactor guanylyltransferase [Bacillus kwashiorkori]|uniref:molybdenum cofactor guanylyltransferase n=1 Tax=Bacillus kwashiorkori TaxID=1522318 RepID=UPI0007836B33|nr:molybdenum cofactor guanylyltransferase [Bacillus kwashiorkori]
MNAKKMNAIVLAGGASRRMGRNKALLQYNGITAIERLIVLLERIVNKVIVVGREDTDYSFVSKQIVYDMYHGFGPLAGIHAGLMHSDTEVNLVIAVDMPFVDRDVITFLAHSYKDENALIPKIDNRLQPLFALYHRRIFPSIEQSISNQELSMQLFITKINGKILLEEDFPFKAIWLNRVFSNTNYPEEYEIVRSLVQ